MDNLLSLIESHPKRCNFSIFNTESYLDVRHTNGGYIIESLFNSFKVTPYKIRYDIRYRNSGIYDEYCYPSDDEDWLEYESRLAELVAITKTQEDIMSEPDLTITLSITQTHYIGEKKASVYKIGAEDMSELMDNIINIIMY